MEKPNHLYEYFAEVREVTDGDTIVVDIDLGLRTWRHGEKLRLVGIDAPEMRGPSRLEGYKVRQWLIDRLAPHEFILIRTVKDETGKYGRWLADVLTWDESGEVWQSVNQELLDLGMARRLVY